MAKSKVLRPQSKKSKRDWWQQVEEMREAEAEAAAESQSHSKVLHPSEVPPKPVKRPVGRPRRAIILTPGIETEEQRARRNHQALPPLPPDATPAARRARRRRGGRPPGVRMSLETRIRRAYASDRTYLVLNGTDVLELHALYNIINPAGDLLRGGSKNSQVAGLRGSGSFDFDGQINARWLRMTLGQLMVRAAAADAEDGIGIEVEKQ